MEEDEGYYYATIDAMAQDCDDDCENCEYVDICDQMSKEGNMNKRQYSKGYFLSCIGVLPKNSFR